MASGTLPKPGSEYGPCRDGCKHTDCASMREVAARPCAICGNPIGYDRHFYIDARLGGTVHYSCVKE